MITIVVVVALPFSNAILLTVVCQCHYLLSLLSSFCFTKRDVDL